jgi:hypothetical protein
MSTPNNNSLNTIATNLYGDTQVLNFNFPTISNNELFKKQDGDNITGTKIYSTGTDTSKTISFTTDGSVISALVGYMKGEIDGALQKLRINTTGSVTDGITITSQGRVGIGIVEPEEDLEVDGSIQIDSANVSKLKFQKSGPSPHALGEIDAETDGTNGGLIGIKTKVDGGSVTEKLRINNQGAIGIGGANYGSSGQVIVSRGPDNPVEWADQADTSIYAPKASPTFTGTLLCETIRRGVSGQMRIECFDNDIVYVADTNSGSNNTHFFGAGTDYNNGRVWAGEFKTTSDDRLKWEETEITDGLAIIDKLKPQIYWKGHKLNVEPRDDERVRESGFIAQDVEKIPELKHIVSIAQQTEEREESYSLCYTQLIAYNVSAIKNLHKLVKSLQEEIQILKK